MEDTLLGLENEFRIIFAHTLGSLVAFCICVFRGDYGLSFTFNANYSFPFLFGSH